MTDVGGFINHGPLMEAVAAEARGAGGGSLEHREEPLETREAGGFDGAEGGGDAIRGADVAGIGEEVVAPGAREGDAETGMPAAELGWGEAVVGEEKIVNGMGVAAEEAGEVGIEPRGDAGRVGGGHGLPLGGGEDGGSGREGGHDGG